MPEPRYQRRKEDRPQEITAAALAAFAEYGYAGTRVEEVAKRAGVSKGLLYLYFKTKEELFKAVVRSFVIPRIDALTASVATSDLSAEEIIRGPLLGFMKSLPRSPVGVVVRLMISEGSKHPDLVAFYWDNVVSRGIDTLAAIVERGVANGEFRRTAVSDMPHVLVLPAIFSLIFTIVFGDQSLDTDKLIDTHIDIVVEHLKKNEGIAA
jgi:AcrR family transcriptional regulator